jgi:hypothetical protein
MLTQVTNQHQNQFEKMIDMLGKFSFHSQTPQQSVPSVVAPPPTSQPITQSVQPQAPIFPANQSAGFGDKYKLKEGE